MQTGLILNSIICLVITGAAFWVSRLILHRERKRIEDLIISGFWMVVGLTWLFVGIGHLIYQSGYTEYDLVLNQFLIQVLIYIQLSLGITYVIHRVFQKKQISLLILFICLTLSAIACYFLAQPEGLVFFDETYFSVEYKINEISWNIFQYLLAFGLVFLFYDTLKRLSKKIKGSKGQSGYLLVNYSILIYSLIGYFDNQGYNATWTMVLFRSLIILSIFFLYSCSEILSPQGPGQRSKW